jgi:uracil-DNA glycosylase
MNLMEELKAEVAKCERCSELVKSRSKTVFGDGNYKSKILFVGEAPGADEDAQGVPFVGRAGQFLTSELEKLGISRKNYYITNTLKCRPAENRPPEPAEMLNCSGFLASQIALIKPKIIVTLGRFGLTEIVKKDMKISEVHGKPIRSKDGVIFFPMYHPSAALRKGEFREAFITDAKKFKKLLEREGLI